MRLNFGLFILLCVVLEILCFDKNSGCDQCRNGYTRIKRAKFYQSPPLMFYNRPPFSPPIRGPFSYTPPPGYTSNDIGPHPPNLRPYKVSKRPVNEGLGDEDINNLFKYLSKKDLKKVIDFANEKERHEKYRESNGIGYEYSPSENQDSGSAKIINLANPSPSEIKYTSEDDPNIFFNTQSLGPIISPQIYSQIPLKEEARQEEQFSFLDAYIHKDIQGMTPNNNVIFTDSSTMQEEILPKPTNLRDNDYEISFTNNVQSVARPEVSYKLESFASLPLMDYEDSKLYSVDSYKVPHYSVTSGKPPTRASQSSPSSFPSPNNVNPGSGFTLFGALPVVEPAPPASLVKDLTISDAHLKATKIWTHKSKGTAYTLHDDGTLTLEKPTPPKFRFS